MSLFKDWAKKTLTAPKKVPPTPRARPAEIKGWWGIVNGVGNLSEVQGSRGMAEIVKENRGDGSHCRLVPVSIRVEEGGESPDQKKPRKKKTRKKK